MAHRDEPFHNPFRDQGDTLKRAMKQARRRARCEAEAARLSAHGVSGAHGERGVSETVEQSADSHGGSGGVVLSGGRAAPEAAPPAGPGGAHESRSEEEQFRLAMAGVAPLPPDPRVGSAQPEGAAHPVVRDADAEVVARLGDLVAGTVHFDISDTVEHVDGLARGVDRRLLRRLRRGDFSVQAHLDLHGLVRQDARAEVARFLASSRLQGLRCVLIVHGRGRNSKDQQPVLKPALVTWLTHSGIGKAVLAFCTARPADGGAGALYVLLRR